MINSKMHYKDLKINTNLASRGIFYLYNGGSGLVAKSCPTLAIPWTVACRTLSMGFSRQEYCSGLPFPSLGDLPNPSIEPRSLPHCRQILHYLTHQGRLKMSEKLDQNGCISHYLGLQGNFSFPFLFVCLLKWLQRLFRLQMGRFEGESAS